MSPRTARTRSTASGMKKKRRRGWWEYGDELLIEVNRDNDEEFRRASTMPYDEINQTAGKIRSVTVQIYTKIRKRNRKALEALWDWCFIEEMEDLRDMGFGAEVPEAVKDHAVLDAFLDDTPGPATKYIYDREIKRKRSRLFESLVIDYERGDRKAVEDDYERARKLWRRQTAQTFLDVERLARTTAIMEAGVEKVIWRTMEDEKVCEECEPRDGMVFDIDRVPDTHYYCRCWLEPVR